MWDRRARVIDVKDGDTLKVVLDQGFGDTKTLDLRLGETWAPEKAEAGGVETRRFVLDWLIQRHDGTDWPFVVTTARTRTDKEQQTFGRYVGVVTTPDGQSLNRDINNFVAANNYSGGIGSK